MQARAAEAMGDVFRRLESRAKRLHVVA